jgi:hypothetical protein
MRVDYPFLSLCPIVAFAEQSLLVLVEVGRKEFFCAMGWIEQNFLFDELNRTKIWLRGN